MTQEYFFCHATSSPGKGGYLLVDLNNCHCLSKAIVGHIVISRCRGRGRRGRGEPIFGERNETGRDRFPGFAVIGENEAERVDRIGEPAEAAVVAATLVDHPERVVLGVGDARDAALADAVTPDAEGSGVERHEKLAQQISIFFWRKNERKRVDMDSGKRMSVFDTKMVFAI